MTTDSEHSGAPKLLVLGSTQDTTPPRWNEISSCFETDVVADPRRALERLRDGDYQAVLAHGDGLPFLRRESFGEADLVLDTIGEGVCIVDADGTCLWANRRMRELPGPALEKTRAFCRQMLTNLRHNGHGQTGPPSRRTATFEVEAGQYFESIVAPVYDDDEVPTRAVALVSDATDQKQTQKKIDAIDAAGRELAQLESDAVARLGPGQRLQLLRDKIIRYSKDLLRFDHFAIRVLDQRTNKLELVIAEALPPAATEIELYAAPEGNGISGYVASSGRSYICHDVEKDPRYVLGLEHCKSSLTVPLLLHQRVIGVYNIESRETGAFGEQDRQFAEIFGRYVAFALNILNLLVVERSTVSGQLADSAIQEMAQPLNDIRTEIEQLREHVGADSHDAIDRVLGNVESVRQAVDSLAAGPKSVLGADASEGDDAPSSLENKRVLVADDEQNIRETIANVLRKQGCEARIAKDGFEAANLLEDELFDLVISDIKMPYRNGYEIFACAKRVREDLPVILMTGFGYDPSHSVVRASEEGLSAVLFKPFKVDQLLEEVCKAVSSGEGSSQAADRAG